MATCGEYLVRLLEAYGVELIFGIPGVHTVELYRGLPATKIRHIAPRHEQGAGFMADGYARHRRARRVLHHHRPWHDQHRHGNGAGLCGRRADAGDLQRERARAARHAPRAAA
jgi:hypothetical protein